LAEEAARLAREQHLAYLKSDLGKVDQMRGIEFEQYVAARLRQNGWEVSTTAATGDYGVDLIAKRADERSHQPGQVSGPTIADMPQPPAVASVCSIGLTN
jgi:Restriction endonuclease